MVDRRVATWDGTPGDLNLRWRRGDGVRVPIDFVIVDDQGVVIDPTPDLSDRAWAAQIRERPARAIAHALVVDVTDAATGTLYIVISAAISRVAPDDGWWDLQQEYVGLDPLTVLAGRTDIDGDVVRP